MENPKQQVSIEEQRLESVYQAERNPRYIFHDAIIVISLFTVYGLFLAMGKLGTDDESDT